jgi:hypothetical protein
VLFNRKRRASKGDEGRPEEPEAKQRRKQSFSSEAEATGSGAEARRATSQEETNPAGHRGRGRCGYAQEERRASEGDSEVTGESRAERSLGKVRDSRFAGSGGSLKRVFARVGYKRFAESAMEKSL